MAMNYETKLPHHTNQLEAAIKVWKGEGEEGAIINNMTPEERKAHLAEALKTRGPKGLMQAHKDIGDLQYKTKEGKQTGLEVNMSGVPTVKTLRHYFESQAPNAAVVIAEVAMDESIPAKTRLVAADLILKYSGYEPPVKVQIEAGGLNELLKNIFVNGGANKKDEESIDAEFE